jgi:hypothetical protein
MVDCNEKSDHMLSFQSDLINNHQESVSILDVHSLHWRKGNQNSLRTRREMYQTRSLNESQIPQPVHWVTNESHLNFHVRMIKSFIVPLNHGRDRRWADVKPCSPPSCCYILRSLWLRTLPACSQIKILPENRRTGKSEISGITRESPENRQSSEMQRQHSIAGLFCEATGQFLFHSLVKDALQCIV